MTASKNEIRRNVKALKKSLDDSYRKKAAASVLTLLLQCDEIANCRNILLYHALPDELPTRGIIEAFREKGLRTFLPRVAGDDLEVVEFTGSNISTGAFGIEEPIGKDSGIGVIDAAIVPGVAFDRSGNRLGRGKGYYDRLLRNAKCHKIGVAFKCQIVDEVPHEPHDITMDMIITDEEIIRPLKA